jgi:hypothetical protein
VPFLIFVIFISWACFDIIVVLNFKCHVVTTLIVEKFRLGAIVIPILIIVIIPCIGAQESTVVLKPKVWVSGVMNRLLVLIIVPLLLWIISDELFNDNVSPAVAGIWFSGQNKINFRSLRFV